MYGQYSRDLGEFAKQEATRIKILTNKSYAHRYRSYGIFYEKVTGKIRYNYCI